MSGQNLNSPRRVVLRRLAPKCAERIAMLSPSADIAPSMGYHRGLVMPEDALGVVNVIGVDEWTAYGRTIYIEQGVVDPPYAVIYTADVVDLPAHVQAAVDALAKAEQRSAYADDRPRDSRAQMRAQGAWDAYAVALAAARAEDERQSLETAA